VEKPGIFRNAGLLGFGLEFYCRGFHCYRVTSGNKMVLYDTSVNHASMHIITRKRLNQFATTHPETKNALAQWYQLVKQNEFSSFIELRATFPSADQVNQLTVFNIGGNKVRLIAAIHYNRKKVYIRAVLTHKEYDEGRWKK
jgi:mRNA interferase HigB